MDMHNVAERLGAKFGYGGNALKRKALYQRLEQLVEQLGECCYVVIATTAADASGKKDPGRYFAFVVMRRLFERGILEVDDF